MDSKLVEYYKERMGFDVILDPSGFIAYSIEKPFCAIQDLYIRKEARRSRKAWMMADLVAEIARGNECTHLWAEVQYKALNATDSMQAILAYGFKLAGGDSQRIIFTKELTKE